MNKTTNKYTPEVRERAVRMVLNGEVLWGACALKLGADPHLRALLNTAPLSSGSCRLRYVYPQLEQA